MQRRDPFSTPAAFWTRRRLILLLAVVGLIAAVVLWSVRSPPAPKITFKGLREIPGALLMDFEVENRSEGSMGINVESPTFQFETPSGWMFNMARSEPHHGLLTGPRFLPGERGDIEVIVPDESIMLRKDMRRLLVGFRIWRPDSVFIRIAEFFGQTIAPKYDLVWSEPVRWQTQNPSTSDRATP